MRHAFHGGHVIPYDSIRIGDVERLAAVNAPPDPVSMAFDAHDEFGVDLSKFIGAIEQPPDSLDMHIGTAVVRVLLGPIEIDGSHATVVATPLQGPRLADGRWSRQEVAR